MTVNNVSRCSTSHAANEDSGISCEDLATKLSLSDVEAIKLMLENM